MLSCPTTFPAFSAVFFVIHTYIYVLILSKYSSGSSSAVAVAGVGTDGVVRAFEVLIPITWPSCYSLLLESKVADTGSAVLEIEEKKSSARGLFHVEIIQSIIIRSTTDWVRSNRVLLYALIKCTLLRLVPTRSMLHPVGLVKGPEVSSPRESHFHSRIDGRCQMPRRKCSPCCGSVDLDKASAIHHICYVRSALLSID